jgi:D-alanine-D-alanine ligase
MMLVKKPINQSKVLLLMGGTSAEREISLKSGTAIESALLKLGAEVIRLDPAKQATSEISNCIVDFAFIALHGRDGEDGVVQAVLKANHIPYTGSQVASSALAMDKYRTKLIWSALQLPTPKFISVKSGDVNQKDLNEAIDKLGLPVFVKPIHEGSSVGMTKVISLEGLAEALSVAFEYDQSVLIEEFVSGREFTVTVLQGKALPAIELKTPRDFYDYQAKYQSERTEYICPAPLTEQQTIELQNLALESFEALGCSGWGRVDIMLNANNEFRLLEVNTVPGMTEKSLVPMAAKASGLNFESLVVKIAETSEALG